MWVEARTTRRLTKKPDVGGDAAKHTSAKPNLEVREEDLKAALSVAHGPTPPTGGKSPHADGTSGQHAARKELGW